LWVEKRFVSHFVVLSGGLMTRPFRSEEIGQLHAEMCSALADPRRLQILYLLARQDMTVGELTQQLGISQPSTSRHLRTLRSRGLVRATRTGQSVVYSLTDPRVIGALETLRTILYETLQRRARVAAGSLAALPSLVEE